MVRPKRSLKTVALWGCLVVSGYLLGVAGSSTMAAYGITSFANDRRGEWFLVTAPIILLVAAALGFPSFRALRRSFAGARLVAVVVAMALAGWAFTTWRFANAA
ncbi:hypothetical protein GCM10027188_29610 [Lysobacter humi (ex Lee et al. 2017)]